MAEVSTAQHAYGSMDMIPHRDAAPRSPVMVTETPELAQSEPSPPFVFPGFQDPTTMQDTYRMQSIQTETSAARRRPDSRSRPQTLSINNALPAFDFGPGSTSNTSTRGLSPSPTRSPARRTPPLHLPSGHRRGGSEFVGGDVTNPITAGTSPTKAEEATTLPSKPPVLPTSRRGHAHRRSGALSQHDLSMILKPSSDNRAGSAPTTPCDPAFQFPRPSHTELDRSLSQPASMTFAEGVASAPPVQENGPSRTRVTFNSDPEYIPRPLSTISSETSSSMSTARANHSVNDSISSLVSGCTSSPSSARIARFGVGSSEGESRSNRMRSSGSLSIPAHSCELLENKRPSTAPMKDLEEQDQEQNSFGLPDGSDEDVTTEHNVNDTAPRPAESGSLTSFSPKLYSSLEARKQQFPPPGSPVVRPRTSPEPKDTKRQKKVKSWAGSILSRKAKQQGEQTDSIRRRTPTPPNPTLNLPPHSDFSLDDVTFDDDTTCIIETPRQFPIQPPRSSFNHQRRNYNASDLTPDDESPMLDIDAALGALDRSGDGSATYDSSVGFGSSKRRMHSSGETGGFSGPGMHYHRRAESAPELDSFEHGRLGFAHRGSNPAMAEAIEEEEEDDTLDQGLSEDQEMGLGVNIVESGHMHNEPIRRRRRRAEEIRKEAISPKTLDSESQRVLDGVEIVGADEEPRFSIITKSSDDSTITPTLSPEPPAPTSAPLGFAMDTSSLHQTTETASAISSPDFAESSFDNQDLPRLHTATSSITDRATLSSSRTGENGHGSVDDVPSLTSSASTMISGHPMRYSSSANTTASSADRSSSLSAAVPARTNVRPGSSKRSSLASLSRLVGSSYNKSKLNIEELAPPDSPERLEKKKRKRMSRLMFWKSREKLTST